MMCTTGGIIVLYGPSDVDFLVDEQQYSTIYFFMNVQEVVIGRQGCIY
jgi:hypothetical protein